MGENNCTQIFRQKIFVEKRFLKNMHTKTHISWNFNNILLIFYFSYLWLNFDPLLLEFLQYFHCKLKMFDLDYSATKIQYA